MAKKCQRCGYENTNAMHFCLNCGTTLPDVPAEGFHKTDSPTESLGGAVCTNFGAQRQTENFAAAAPSYPTFSQPKNKSKIGLIIGGAAALLLLLSMAGAAIIFYNFKSKRVAVIETPTPTASPSPRSIVSDTPSLTPDKSPAPNPAATPQISFTPPLYATKTGVFTVYANRGWQISEIDVIRLEQFTVGAVGLIDVADVKTQITAKGLNDKTSVSRRIYPEYPTGALLFRTHYADGHLGNVMPVSAGNFVNFPDELGRLEFCVNDNASENNGGQFTVVVKATGTPKANK